MIERYFIKGACYRWNAPAAISNLPKDGSIIVNPPAVPGSMTYIGLDDEIFDPGLPNVSTLGFYVNLSFAYDWLYYVLGRTAKLGTTQDVLTGFMSGCWIATWQDTQRWVGHIGTIESVGKNEPPNSTVKINFSTSMPRNVRGYNPADAWSFDEISRLMGPCKLKPTPKILSLVTATGDFHSILLFNRMSEPGIWVCGGRKKVDGVGYEGMSNALVATRPRR